MNHDGVIGLIVKLVGAIDVLILIAYLGAGALVGLDTDASKNTVLIYACLWTVFYAIGVDKEFVLGCGVKSFSDWIVEF